MAESYLVHMAMDCGVIIEKVHSAKVIDNSQKWFRNKILQVNE